MQHILLAVFPRQTGQETEAIIFTIAKVIQLYNTAKQKHKKRKPILKNRLPFSFSG
jgi:hypothetical protein